MQMSYFSYHSSIFAARMFFVWLLTTGEKTQGSNSTIVKVSSHTVLYMLAQKSIVWVQVCLSLRTVLFPLIPLFMFWFFFFITGTVIIILCEPVKIVKYEVQIMSILVEVCLNISSPSWLQWKLDCELRSCLGLYPGQFISWIRRGFEKMCRRSVAMTL